MKVYAVAFLVALLGAALPAGAAPAAGPPVELNVLLSTTGSGAFLGSREAEALAVLEKTVNAAGGIKGRPVKFVYADDQTSPVNAVQLTNALIAKHVPVILGSSLAATCSAMMALVEKNGPVQYCYSPVVHGPSGGYVFSASAGSDSIATALIRFLREKGWPKIALITSTDASGSDFDRQFDAAMTLPENKNVQVAVREHFNPSDISVSAQMARIKASAPQALITFATGTPLGTLLRGFHESGMDIPITAGAGNMIYAQIAQYAGFVPRRLYFAATRGVAPDRDLRPGPIMDAQKVYFSAFERAGGRPDFATSLVWDPTMMVIDALRKLGPDTSAERLKEYLVGLHGWAGVDGLYDFRDGSQRGIGVNAMQIYHWNVDSGRFEVASRPGGHVK